MTNSHTCIIVDDEPMAREILTTYISKIPNLQLVKSCASAMEALSILNTQKIDILFLDINMPDISGLTFAKSIIHQNKIIFTTAYREYALDGFNLQAIDYLLKPIAFDRFLQAINKFFQTHIPNNSTIENKEHLSPLINDFIFVRADRKMLKVNFKDILYIESLSDYIKIYTHQNTIITRETITNIEQKLPSKNFIRTHRSFIIAINHIDSFTNEYIEIAKKTIPISRSYKEEVLGKLNTI